MPVGEEDLGDGLVLRPLRDERDAERFVAFYEALFGPRLAVCPGYLTRHHPVMKLGDFSIVEDRRSGKIVSTTCLIPWQLSYEGIPLQTAQLEYVATHPDYRRRGLVRAQVQRFHEMVASRDYDLCLIEGIPYYYRQFGYAYAVDHRAADSLPSWCIPDPPAGYVSPFDVRPASADDIPSLHKLYRDAMTALPFHVERTPDYWRFLLQWVQLPARLLVDRRNGSVAGYFCPVKLSNDRGVKVMDSGIASHEAAMAVLRQLKAETRADMQLAWPETGTLVQLGRTLGSKPLPAYQWLLRIPDVARFLTKSGPVLERRLAGSDCAALTADLRLNLYRDAFVLRFQAGKLLGVECIGFVDASMGADGGDLCIPPDAFVRLVLGYRGLDELRDAWPDIVVKPVSRRVLEVLFPRLKSGLCVLYDYCGPTPASPPAAVEGLTPGQDQPALRETQGKEGQEADSRLAGQ